MLLVAKYKEQISVQYKPIDHRLLFYSAGDASVRDMGGQMLIAPSRVCLHARRSLKWHQADDHSR